MGWNYARIDFLPINGATYCVFCNRELKAKKGIVVRDSAGRERFTGPNCAKSHLGDPAEKIIDVAGLAMLVVEGKRGDAARAVPVPAAGGDENFPSDGPADQSEGSVRTQTPQMPAIEYLRLRYEVMGQFNSNVSARMREAYSGLQENGSLDEESERFLLALMRKSAAENSVFSDKNIRRCIGLEYWLKLALHNTRPERREYLTSMLETLHKEWSLSRRQIDAINKWGKGLRKQLSSFPRLNNASFAGVTRPDFMRRPDRRS